MSSSITHHCQNCDFSTEFFQKFDSKLSIYQCSKCEGWSFFHDEVLNFKEIYDEGYFQGDEYLDYDLGRGVYETNFLRKLRKLERVLDSKPKSEIRILEIGCADGSFLQILKDQGYPNCRGLEVSDYSRQVALSRGLQVLDSSSPQCEEAIRGFRPNVIVAWDVWEHLDEPASFFGNLFSISDSKLTVAISTVDASALIPRMRGIKWRQFHPPSHINYPTRKSFEFFFEKNKMALQSISTFGYSRPLADYLAVFFGKRSTWLKRFKILFRIPIYLDLYDIQLIIAKR